MHEPDGLAGHRASRSGDPGDRNREVDRRVRQCAPGHGFRGLAAHGSVTCKRGWRDANHRLLGFIAVGDEATLEHVGGAGDFGKRRRQESSGSTIRRRRS